jgi:Mg-chelatase subunit ChlD
MKLLISILIGLLVSEHSRIGVAWGADKAANATLLISKETKEVSVGSPFILKVELRAQKFTSSSGTIPLPRLRTEGVLYNNKNRFEIKSSTSPSNGNLWHVFSYRTELVALNKGARDIEFSMDFETMDFSGVFRKKINHSLTNKITIDVMPIRGGNKGDSAKKSGDDQRNTALKILAMNNADEVSLDPFEVQDKEVNTDAGDSPDVIIALDLSDDMMAEDLKPTRIGAVKSEISDFIRANKDLRIGLVAFSGVASCVALPGTDSKELERRLALLNTDSFKGGKEGVSVGAAILSAVNYLSSKKSKARPIIILITNGISNAGRIPAPMAASVAKEMGVKIYPIGIGKTGTLMYKKQNGFNRPVKLVGVNEGCLRNIAEKTGGKAQMATTAKEIREAFDHISDKIRQK